MLLRKPPRRKALHLPTDVHQAASALGPGGVGGAAGGSRLTSGKGLAADAHCSANPTSTTLPPGFLLGDITPSSLFELVESGLSVT